MSMLVSYPMGSQPRDWLLGSPMGDNCTMVYVGPNNCLECGKLLDGATDPFKGTSPSPGDYTICIGCGHLMVFGDDMKLRQPTDAEHVAVAGDRRILMIQRARARVDRKTRGDEMIRYVRDEKGIVHTHCHGVPAEDWFTFVQKAREMLSNDEQRAAQGIMQIVPDRTLFCSDPDCRRLNRIRGDDSPSLYAGFWLTRGIEPVHPADPEDRDVKICEGHPWKAGSLLCGACARVALAKRLINRGRKADENHG